MLNLSFQMLLLLQLILTQVSLMSFALVIIFYLKTVIHIFELMMQTGNENS